MTDDEKFDINYGYFFNQANERFYARLDGMLNFVQLVGGSGAAVGAAQQSSGIVIAAGLALSICAAISMVVQPAVKAERHAQHKAKWRELLTKQTANLQAEIVALQATGPSGMRSLGTPALNDTIRARQTDDTGCVPLSRFERFMAAMT